ncbi:MAG: hypothetical protein LBP20_01395 [Treponema sp.]|jgi:hypothetical protein|nr:hypothetical protein [Treponema sp.]
MVLLFGKKWPCYILAAHLTLAMMGTFTFSIVENLDTFSLMNKAASGGFFTLQDCSIDWLIEDTAVISRASEYSSFSLRGGIVRVLMALGIQSAGAFLVQSAVRTTGRAQYPNIKNTILVKLRI